MFLSEIMSIYLLATLIQLRTSLPPNFGTGGGGGELGADGGAGAGTGGGAADAGKGGVSMGQGTGPGIELQLLLSSLPDFNTAFGALFGECNAAQRTQPVCSTQLTSPHRFKWIMF